MVGGGVGLAASYQPVFISRAPTLAYNLYSKAARTFDGSGYIVRNLRLTDHTHRTKEPIHH